jgi:DNA-binding transcriptional LysR family regulator
MNWEDYRYILAISRAGGLPRAAEVLNVSISTVFRRLEKIEQASGGSLFHRKNSGYVANDICEELIAVAQKIEIEVNSAERLISGLDKELTGSIKITSSETLTSFFLARHIAEIQSAHPNLIFELHSDNKVLDLKNREADIALRPIRPVDNDLFGRKVSDICWGVYGSNSIKQAPGFNDLAAIKSFKFVGFSENHSTKAVLSNELTRIKGADVSHSTNSLISNASLAASGAAMAVLPCFLGEQWPGLRCYASPIKNRVGELWVVCHKDLRRNAKTRAVFDFIVKAAEKDKALFYGKN